MKSLEPYPGCGCRLAVYCGGLPLVTACGIISDSKKPSSGGLLCSFLQWSWCAKPEFISVRAFWAMHFSASPLNFIFNPAKGRLNGYMSGKMQEVLKQMVGWAAWVTCQTLDCVAIWMKIPPQLGFYFSNLWMTAAPGSPWQWDLEQLPAIIHLPSRLILLPLWIFLVPFSEKECHSRLISWWCKWFSRADEYQ